MDTLSNFSLRKKLLQVSHRSEMHLGSPPEVLRKKKYTVAGEALKNECSPRSG